MVWRWDQADPFGSATPNQNPASLGTFVYNPRFPGQLFDSEDNLAYNYFRNYDPTLGRYVQSDPIGLVGGVGTYGYAGNNPLDGTDPRGLYDSFGSPMGVGSGEGFGFSAQQNANAAAAAATDQLLCAVKCLAKKEGKMIVGAGITQAAAIAFVELAAAEITVPATLIYVAFYQRYGNTSWSPNWCTLQQRVCRAVFVRKNDLSRIDAP